MEIKSDIQIAQETKMKNIVEIAETAGIDDKYIETYGQYKAKIDYKLLEDMKDKPDGKLILVTAISPTPAGEGKTTTSVGLADALHRLGKNTGSPCRPYRQSVAVARPNGYHLESFRLITLNYPVQITLEHTASRCRVIEQDHLPCLFLHL